MKQRIPAVAAAALLLLGLASAASAEWFLAADRLVNTQQGDGSWAGEGLFTGHIVPGLARCYELTGHTPYKTAADSGGTYIFNSAPMIPGGSAHNLLGEEAYAMQRLSDIAADPASNVWRTEITNYYEDVRTLYPTSTSGYIADQIVGLNEPSTATVSLAHHTLASYYVGAVDKGVWRSELVNTLGTVDDATATYPVMGLGATVWGLGPTGGYDSTLVDPGAAPGSQWDGVALEDLPGELVSHQEPTSGGFYWRFDHAVSADGWAYGYTEDTVFGTLGLISAHDAGQGNYWSEIGAGRSAVASGFGPDGSLKEHLWGNWPGMVTRHCFAGEALRLAIPEPATVSFLAGGALLALARVQRRRARKGERT